jgi:hypothetical protein
MAYFNATHPDHPTSGHFFKWAGLALALTAGALSHKASYAATVEWTGAVANTCVVTLNSNGLLGVSINGQSMSSEQTTGQAASVAVMSTGPNLVTFGGPAMTLWSPTYTGTPLIQTKQRSNKGHSGTWQATAHQATIDAGDTLFEVHAQIDDPSNAFPMGAYKVSSEVTCAPAN